MQPNIMSWRGVFPKFDESVYIAPSSSVIGAVEIGENSSVWFDCTIRGDVNYIRIGKRTNIQDGTIIHVTRETHPTLIGDDVTIGHSVTLHGCTIQDNCLIGMGATIMDGAVVESGAMVAAGALVTPNKIVKSGEVWGGNPAKKLRDIKQEEADDLPASAQRYAGWAAEYVEQAKAGTVVEIKRLENGEGLGLPFKGTDLAAGFDVHSAENITLEPGMRKLVATGFAVALPDGWEMQVRPRSGLAFKNGLTVLNSPGTIDADYRGEVKVLLLNTSDEAFEIERGMRIAQLVITEVKPVSFKEVLELSETNRGAGGFGSTGVKS